MEGSYQFVQSVMYYLSYIEDDLVKINQFEKGVNLLINQYSNFQFNHKKNKKTFFYIYQVSHKMRRHI